MAKKIQSKHNTSMLASHGAGKLPKNRLPVRTRHIRIRRQRVEVHRQTTPPARSAFIPFTNLGDKTATWRAVVTASLAVRSFGSTLSRVNSHVTAYERGGGGDWSWREICERKQHRLFNVLCSIREHTVKELDRDGRGEFKGTILEHDKNQPSIRTVHNVCQTPGMGRHAKPAA